jgi:hypothetical protein
MSSATLTAISGLITAAADKLPGSGALRNYAPRLASHTGIIDAMAGAAPDPLTQSTCRAVLDTIGNELDFIARACKDGGAQKILHTTMQQAVAKIRESVKHGETAVSPAADTSTKGKGATARA